VAGASTGSASSNVRTVPEEESDGAGSALDEETRLPAVAASYSSNVSEAGLASASLNVATTVSESASAIDESVGRVVSSCATVPSVDATVVVASAFVASSRSR